MIAILLAAACAALTIAPTPPIEPSDPWAGEPPCTPGPWRIACDGCEPVVDVVGVAVCGERDAMLEALGALPGGFGVWRESNPSADLRVGEE